jgi:hydrogenase maturation protease
MKRPLVIGIGNPLRGDDGFGPAVIEALRAEGEEARAKLLSVHQLMPELVDDLERATRVAFIDASTTVGPGEIFDTSVESAPSAARWTHHLDPGSLIALAAETAGVDIEARCIGVGADTFEFGAELTEAARGRLAEVVERVRDWLAAAEG